MEGSVVTASAATVRESAERVSAALEEVVRRLELPSRSPRDLARRLNVHRTLASRLLAALKMSDSLAVVSNLPGRQGLNLILQSAAEIIGPETVDRAQAALHEFESIVENGLGGRDVLEVALGAWLPETRDRFELGCKQQVYRGLCGLVGATADVSIGALIRYPSEDGLNANQILLFGLVGLRRLYPGADIPIGTLGLIPGTRTPTGAVIENLPGSPDPNGAPLIAEFCSPSLPPLREIRLGNYRQYLLPGESIGSNSTVDIFTGLLVRNIGPLCNPPFGPQRRTGGANMVEVPTKSMIMDLFVEERETPLKGVQMFVHRTGQRGGVDPNDPLREIDRVRSNEVVKVLGSGPDRFGMSEVYRYPELIRYVCDRVGLDWSTLVGHRCRVEYPLPHLQYSMGFELPPDPEKS